PGKVGDDEVTDVLGEGLAGLGGLSGVADEEVGAAERGDGADADGAPLAVVGGHDDGRGGFHQCTVGLGLHDVGRVVTSMLVYAVQSEDEQVYSESAFDVG